MKESIGEQVARETKMLDVAVKILMEVAKVAFKRGGDAELPARRNVENGGVNEPVGDAKSKLELKNRSQSSIVVLIRQQDTKGDCLWQQRVYLHHTLGLTHYDLRWTEYRRRGRLLPC